jgi:hypothetical protein
MKKLSCSLLLAAAAFAAQATAATVPPQDPKLQYTGRIDFANPSAPVITWPNTSIAGNFDGGSLAVRLDDQYGKNYFNVFIDGDLAHPFVIHADKGEKTYPVAGHFKAGSHSFLITKRTEGEEGATRFLGLKLDDRARLLPPSPRPAHKIEFFGDSITSGMGNESADTGRDDLASDKNSFMSYAAIAARNLNAEMHMTSQSGIGVMISWFPFTMPDFYDQLSAVGNNDTKWDFSTWTPDVVVINLLQNDFWLIGRDHKLQPDPAVPQRIQAYKTFVKRIRQLYPNAYIICSLGSMEATRPGSEWPGYISTAVNQIRSEGHDERIDTLFFAFTGYGQHPRVKQHQANAEKLTTFIKGKMGW